MKRIKKPTVLLYAIAFYLTICLPGSVGAGDDRSDSGRTGLPAQIANHRTDAHTRIFKPAPASDPMAHALRLINLTPAAMVRPRYEEEGYHMLGRLPIVDQVARSPAALHNWADTFSTRVNTSGQNGSSQLLSTLIREHSGDPGYGPNPTISAADAPDFQEAYRYLCSQFEASPAPDASADIADAGLSRQFSLELGRLLVVIADAARMIRQALAALSPEEIQYLSSRPERYFFPGDKRFNFLTGGTHVQARITDIVRKVDMRSMMQAALTVSYASDEFVYSVKRLQQKRIALVRKAQPGHPIMSLSSPIGPLVLLGPQTDQIDFAGALVVDLGGNDTYTGRIAAGDAVPGRIAVAIDLDGDDHYAAHGNTSVQGYGVLSVGLMVDAAGNDVYQAGDMAQGGGIYGVGLLTDLAGNDQYQMGLMGQGFGVFGLGLLFDRSGDDIYRLTGMGQGAGSTMGLGALCDIEGHDRYEARLDLRPGRLIPDKWSHAQGVGLSIRSQNWTRQPSFYGGIGLLNDAGGDDRYYASDGNAMGSSYFMSIGALVDHAGDDTYHAANGYGIAFAVHLSNAVLIDRQGDDKYHTRMYSGAVASDRSVAVLAEHAGDDIYGPTWEDVRQKLTLDLAEKYTARSENEQSELINAHLAQASYGSGIKPKGLAMLVDASGDDRYFARAGGRGDSLGGVLPPAAPDEWNHALLLDLGGDDRYTPRNCAENEVALRFQNAVCYDTEYHGDPIFQSRGALTGQALPFAGLKVPIEGLSSELTQNLAKLSDKDLWIRFKAIGAIQQLGHEVLPDVIRTLENSQDASLNRNLEEIITVFILARQMKPAYRQAFASLLMAVQPRVQRYAARMLGWWHVRKEVPALQRAGRTASDPVKSDVIWALSQMRQKDVVQDLLAATADHESLTTRRIAIAGLGDPHLQERLKNGKLLENTRNTLLQALANPDPVIRAFAAEGIGNLSEDQEVHGALSAALEDPDVYVRRAAAKALTMSGNGAGIPTLIESLQFPSIDTFPNYDHELVKDLAYYLGIDFDDEHRYAVQTWRDWWDANRHKVRLSENLAIMRDIRNAFTLADESKGVAIFRRLLTAHPKNVVISKRFDRYCYEWITFRLLTRSDVDPAVLERCLALQTIRVELNPQQADKHATLAYFYGRLNIYDKALESIQDAIALNPENSDYQQRFRTYRRLAKGEGRRNKSE